MSRHKIVKNMDLDDEMDDYDGGEDYADDGAEELSEEDKESMRVGTISVREALGDDVPGITDKDIQEALWHYFYDVEKSVNYLLQSRTAKKETTKKKAKGGSLFSHSGEMAWRQSDLEGMGVEWGGSYGSGEYMAPPPTTCSNPFIPADFWKDMGWFNVPLDRQTTFIEPLCPRGGLMGGNPDAAPKMTKLQALAAARKKNAQEQKNNAGASDVTKPMADLSLGAKSGNDGSNAGGSASAPPSGSRITSGKENTRKYPGLKRKDSSPHKQESRPPPSIPDAPSPPPIEPVPEIEAAAPSAFAATMFGDTPPSLRQAPSAAFTLPYSDPHLQPTDDAFAGPSPDDQVLAAQSKVTTVKKQKPPAKTSNEKKADQIANGVEALRIDDTPRATSKNLDVLAEFEKKKAKNAANFVVIGHVDAGKSTLMGRLLLDLNVIDQRTIDKYRKEAEKLGKSSFALAWVLDQGTEERNRGVTIDIATNKFETDKTAFTILDAPGHRDFIPNMIAGASQADFAVLVIDASTGSFESGLKGQTKEHALLARSMGVQRLIIAINKLDTVNWSQDRFDEISQQVSAFLTAAGFQAKNVTFIPVSGLHGDNIARKCTEEAASWYTGPTLVEELDNSEPATRALDKPLRFTIGDIFRGGVQNPLSVSGRIEAGSLQTGDALLAQPSGEKCYVKGLEVDNETADWSVAGQNATIHLTGIDPIHLKVGDVLCTPSSPIQCIMTFVVKVLAFEFLMPSGIDVHRGRLHAAGRVTELLATLDKSSGKVTKKKPRIVRPANIARVSVELETALPLEKGQRIVLRSGGETIAAGLIE
ncbi:hypothetical protein V496_09589 [Pseudogymnoascus sp. VKM F-4515 (FW-2607)]|nr:hypothetical protein V496_09589 [Pseudogymnoascus sp. VKM F-4515 (FW-2607)]KFY90325.1 hypothetical protein V498_06058 [Pseudogymnoascus sp. VKM F-4517 (FW-2822)]